MFLDTSVLVPVFVDIHLHHEASFRLFASLDGGEAVSGVHNLAELYSTLTRMPPPNRMLPEEALLAVAETRARVEIVPLGVRGYYEVFEQAAARGVTGRTIHDALVAKCALEAKAEVIYTWNVKHFNSFGPEVAALVRTP